MSDRDPHENEPGSASSRGDQDWTSRDQDPEPPDTDNSREDQLVNEESDPETLADLALAHREVDGEFTASSADRVSKAEAPSQQRRPAPAEGERNAVVGYLGQYEFAAERTLATLREGALVSVRVADVEAGQIDDFQLVSADRVDAHQVKWSRHAGSTVFAEFVNDTKNRTRYIRQLADGWERLSKLHHPRHVVVHFVTNDVASSGSSPTIPRPADTEELGAVLTWSFAAFLAEAWRPAVTAAQAGDDPATAVPSPWIRAMTVFAEASGLDDEAWRRFVADCKLEFGVPSLEASIASAPVTDAERRVLRDDAAWLAHAFMKLVARPDRRVEFTKEQLLGEVGWRHRTEFKHTHEFPDPDIPYRGIVETERQVSDAMERFTGGYIAVVGSPGSGKSTLLTRTLRASQHRVVRYYAFVPNAIGGSLRRGEAVNFFHDLTVMLDRSGIRAGATLPGNDLDLLTQRVHGQLAKASEEWVAGGQRTIILVDGLDHIPREQQPTYSLLSHLPLPEDVPDGVLFVLGTQTDRLQPISQRIRAQLDEQGRRISMRPLERREVLGIVEETASLIPAPTQAERERIYDLSDGHPLALSYIINRLRHSSGTAVAETLEAVEPYQEAIDRQYSTIWGIAEGDVDLARLFALLARVRGPVRLEWLKRWAPPQALHDITTRFAYLFRQGHGGRWSLFHNSFRAFLIERTHALPALGGDADLFTELADRSAATDSSDPEHADELFFRAQAGDNAQVLALSVPEDFRAQFVAGRPATVIREDLALALDIAVAERDVVALTRILLCIVEFGQREDLSDSLPLAETWLELGDADLALNALRDGVSLHTSDEVALAASAALDERGFHIEAREVFTLAEPLTVLGGSAKRTGRSRDEIELLDSWISVAPRFRSISELLDMIQRVRATADIMWPHDEDDQAAADEAEAENRKNRLLQGMAIALDDLGRWADADTVRAAIRSRSNSTRWWFWTQSIAWHEALAADDRPRAESRFSELREALEKEEILETGLGSTERVAMAGGYLQILRDTDAAKRILEGVEQPAPVDHDSYNEDDGWRAFQRRFALNRVLGALGDQRPLHEVVPDVPPEAAIRPRSWDDGTAFVTEFERGVAHLGRLAGMTWTDGHLGPHDFAAHARSLVRLLPNSLQIMHGGYIVVRARNEFFSRLVQIAAKHGDECVAVLHDLFEAEWIDESRRSAWPGSLVRTILVEMLSVGTAADWVVKWLARIEPMTFRGEELDTELAEGIAQARAWVAAGDIVEARSTFERVLSASFGIRYKEDPLSPCLSWAERANSEDPARMSERLTLMAAAVCSLDGAKTERYVAPKLIKASVAAGARPACSLVEWALRNEVREWTDALMFLIDGLVSRAPAAAGALSACYRSVVLPFARAAYVDPVSQLSEALRAEENRQELDALSEAIEVVALRSTRPALRAAADGRLTEAEELLRDKTVNDPTAPDHVVDAFDGMSLPLHELQAHVKSVADVEDLVQRLKPGAHSYRWELVLEPFLDRATADELVGSANAIPQNDNTWKVLAAIAERLLALGDARAQAVIERVIQSSRASGWWRFYDGGSRLTAYELLVRLSPDEGRRTAWKALQDDLAAGEVLLNQLFDDWDRIVSMLSPDTSAIDIWDVVSQHVAALVAHAPQGDSPALPPPEDPGEPTAVVEAVSGLVASYLDHPATTLAQGAQQFFTDRLLAHDTVAEAVLSARLADTDVPNEGALVVLRALARVRGEVPDSMQVTLRDLLHSKLFTDRRAALSLLGPEGETSPEDAGRIELSPTIQRPLPATFRLVHPKAQPPSRRPIPERGAMLEPAEDAADLILTFRAELDLIAQWADVQPEALYHYVAELATSVLPEGSRDYSFDDEPVLRDEMHRLGLLVTYRRPRARRILRAMDEATAMLIDHGRLDERYHSALDRFFRQADPYFVVARPTRRPVAVEPIPERAASQYVGNDWTAGATVDGAITGRVMTAMTASSAEGEDQGDSGSKLPDEHHRACESARAVESTNDEWIVLAEETWLRWLDWKKATETRAGVRLESKVWTSIEGSQSAAGVLDPLDLDGDAEAGQVLDQHVACFSHLTVDEYLSRARGPYSIIVRNFTFRFETPGGKWLAINPALAEHLGWRPAPDGLFRWLDADDNVVAESVWWQDGFAQQRPPLFEDEVGYGWLVRVSVSGWRQIVAAVGQCVDWRRVTRLADEQPPHGVVGWDSVSDLN